MKIDVEMTYFQRDESVSNDCLVQKTRTVTKIVEVPLKESELTQTVYRMAAQYTPLSRLTHLAVLIDGKKKEGGVFPW